MAQMEPAHGKSPAMKPMARQIIAAQKKEIAQFDRWLASRKQAYARARSGRSSSLKPGGPSEPATR